MVAGRKFQVKPALLSSNIEICVQSLHDVLFEDTQKS
jgi:hypothetical protein